MSGADTLHFPAREPAAVVLTTAGRPCHFPLDAILFPEDVAALFAIDVRSAQRKRLNWRRVGVRKVVLFRDVLAFIAEQEAA